MANRQISGVGPLRRVNVNFSPDAYAELEQIAQASGRTVSDVIRDAICFERYITKAHGEGGRLLIERNGEIREIVRLR